MFADTRIEAGAKRRWCMLESIMGSWCAWAMVLGTVHGSFDDGEPRTERILVFVRLKSRRCDGLALVR